MIYLDNAATTLQKPPAVPGAVSWACSHCASPGRGSHAPSELAGRILFTCREEAAAMFDAPGPEQVVLVYNATHALNLAIRTLLHPGDKAVISAWEHNAVTRTLRDIPNLTVRVAEAPLFDDDATVQAFAEALEERPTAVICTAASNVFGYRLPLEKIAGLCRSAEVPLIVDAAQAAGHEPLSLSGLGAAFLAMPGHKGLFGPQGTGLLICGENAPPITPVLTGGTGSESLRQEMPDFLPDRGEAGTQNVCGAAGLLQGLRFVKKTGVHRIQHHEEKLRRRLVRGLEHLPGVEVFSSNTGNQAGVVSLRLAGVDCESAAEWLGRHGVAVRGGMHCAPLAHRSGGTVETGTLRVSFSAFNTVGEVDAFLQILGRLVQNKLT